MTLYERNPMIERFAPGNIVATPGALRAFEETGTNPGDLLVRHVTGDWGTVNAEDKAANEAALHYGSRLLSAYKIGPDQDVRIWIITEAEDEDGFRSTTTFLLPEEY